MLCNISLLDYEVAKVCNTCFLYAHGYEVYWGT